MTAELTREERALIDAAIAEGRVNRIPRGKSSEPEMRWCEKRNGIFYVDPIQMQRLELRRKRISPDNAAKREKRRADATKAVELFNSGRDKNAIAATLGVGRSTINRYLRDFGRIGA